jgi:hypothetical protein
MRKVRDVLRFRVDGIFKRKIAASLSIDVTTADDCIRRVRLAGLSGRWPTNGLSGAKAAVRGAPWAHLTITSLS